MSGWLEKATTAFGRRPAVSEPQPYRLECACGGEVRGFRQSRPQQIICETCGEFLFVLPDDVYPRAKATSPTRRADLSAKPRKARERQTPREPAGLSLLERLHGAAGGLRTSARQLTARARSGVRRKMTPLRLVAAAIALVIGGTIWWGVHARGLEQAELALRESLRQAEAALEKQDYPAAAEQYGIAAGALDRLGHDDERARSIRQMARETSAMVNLASVSLYEIANEAEGYLRKPDNAWEEHFAFRYRGEWIVADTIVTRSTEDAGSPGIRVDYPLFIGSRAVELHIDGAAFPGLELAKGPRRVIFAAQLDRSRYDPQHSVWRIVLRPATAFLWVDRENYRALGAMPEAADEAKDVETVLARQSQMVGVADE